MLNGPITLSHYEPRLVEQLLGWCDEHAEEEPFSIVCIGLALGWSFNEHQIVHARLGSLEPPAITVPLERRSRRAATATARRTVTLEEPAWLRRAAATLLSEHPSPRQGALLLRSRSALDEPRSPTAVRTAVAAAGRAATGHDLSITGLASTRLAFADKSHLISAPFQIGYADSYAVRMLNSRHAPIKLRPPRR